MGLEKYLGGYRIQYGDANVVERHDKKRNNPLWSTVASGDTADEALKNLLRAMNEEELYTDNNFFRLITPADMVITL